jgi:membrane-bound lytic murein transglycosylase D
MVTIARSARLGFAIAMALACSAGVGRAAPEPASGVTPSVPTASPSPSDSALASRIVEWREEFDLALSLRQDGKPEEAQAHAESALAAIEVALGTGPDAVARLDLLDLKDRFSRLRDGARADQQGGAVEPGNEADEKVLNAPAVEELQPQFNADVYRWIEFFTGNGRSTFERWLKRSGRYMSLFRAILQKEGLPPDLVHLVFVESGFNLNARSVSAAVGPWQLLRSSARLFGLDVNQWVDERKDPEKSTVAAARYLKHLYTIFGDWPLALASYNAGEGTVLRAIKKQGTTNYWDLRLPRQTEDYVPQFMAVLAISRDPEKYGFDDVELDDPMEFDEVALKGAVDLRSLANLAECSMDELRQLNPAVVRHAVPGKDGVTTLRVPRGKGEIITRKLQEGARLPRVDLTVRHRVRRGETLQSIADVYHVNAQRLARVNGIGHKRPLRRGMLLTVPAALAATPALADSTDPRASTAYVPERTIRTPAQISGQSSAEGRATHVVRRGETLDKIAEQYGCTASDIRRWNHIKGSAVRRGTRLKILTNEADEAKMKAASADSAQIANLHVPAAKSRHHRRSH